MNPLARWSRFNLVGVLGMAVQLVALSAANRVLRGHYLWASAAALELTLLHNFIWHTRYTWRDRHEDASRPRQLLRFHASNGMISLLGNLALARLLVQNAHLPLLLANAVAILCCSLANFAVSHCWTFAQASTASRTKGLTCGFSLLALLLSASAPAAAQSSPTANSSQNNRPPDYGLDCAYEDVFLEPGSSFAGSATRPTLTAGVTFGQYFAKPFGKGIRASPQFELGLVGPLSGGYPLDGVVSFDEMFANKLPAHAAYALFTAGYTRFFATGNAVNFGVGLDLGRSNSDTVTRIELHDYFLFTGPQQHVVGLRIAFGKLIAD